MLDERARAHLERQLTQLNRLLEDYAASTETDIDDEIVKLVKEKLWPSV